MFARTLSSLALVVTLLAAPVFAGTANAASADEARAYVDKVGQEALGIINQPANKEQKKAQLEKLFSSHVDINWVGKFVLGRNWRQATPEQRTRYLREYQGFIVSNYAGRFADYAGGTYKILNATADGGDQYTVSMQMISPNDQTKVLVDYRLHPADGGQLKIFDVVVEGVSLITTQRAEFAGVLQNSGIDHLTEQLANRTLTTPDQKM